MTTDRKWAEEGTCQSCAKRILWIVVDGKRIPVDPVPPVYDLDLPGKGWKKSLTACVSHFTTCSPAGRARFSGTSKKREAEAAGAPASDVVNADSVIVFGKHQGRKLRDVPADWLLWAYDNIEPRTPFTRGLLTWIAANRERIEKKAEEEKQHQ